MDAFPIKAPRPRHAILSGEQGCVSITILIKPFVWNAEIIDTSIRLDGIELPSVHLADQRLTHVALLAKTLVRPAMISMTELLVMRASY